MQQKINDAINFIKTSHEKVKAGEVINLDSFQTDMQNICTEIAMLPVAESKTYIDQLQSLSDILRDLEIDLRKLHNDVRSEAKNLNIQEKALKSYTTANRFNEENKNGN